MSVDLTALPIADRTPQLLDFGGVLTPPLGGPAQRIDRPGSRWAFEFSTPVMSAADVRKWSALLSRAKAAGGIVRITQPDIVPGNPGVPVVASNIVGGRLVPISGLTPGYTVSDQWVSIIVGGVRYLDRILGDATANASGLMTITLQNLLRVPLPGGETVEIAVPKIEGLVEGNVDGALDAKRMGSFQFVVREMA